MILIDDRAGSRELASHIPTKYRRLARLDYGDIAFTGHGPKGSLKIGYEIKHVPDVVKCIHDGRFAGHQLPGMQREYDLSYLIVLDCVREGFKGVLNYFASGRGRGRGKGVKGKWREPFGGQRYPLTYAAYRKWLLTIEVQGGARVLHVDGLEDCACVVMAHYKWWTEAWDSHKSLKTFDDSKTFSVFTEPTTLRKMAAQLKQVRWVRSKAVERHFDSVADMVNASERDWLEIDGIGPKIARAVVEDINRDVHPNSPPRSSRSSSSSSSSSSSRPRSRSRVLVKRRRHVVRRK